ncbi:IgGFc-binding protein-like [Amphiura filiformis]|uniref:IgGFc-binding protein-like n=1 Tax=Amphiura filiformis TaxID=82378 RepID=UPI003B215F0F
MKSLLVPLAFVIYGVTGVLGNDDSLWMRFVFTFPYSYTGQIPRVYITTEVNHPVMVSVSVPGIGFITSTYVTQNQGAAFNLTNDAGITDSSSIKEPNKTVIVTSTDNVSVHGYYVGYFPASHDGWFVLPTTALGNDYVAVGYDQRGISLIFSEFVVTAIEDNTKVYIKGQIELSVTLQQYESYQFVSDHVNQPDITGMSIKADKLISVMSGHQCAYVPANVSGCDYLMEHIPPVSTLGHQYILAPFLGRTSGFVYRVVSTSPGTTNVSLSGETISLSSGEFYEGDFVTSDEVLMVIADKPIMVVQYAKGGRTDGVAGDAFMVVIPSTQRFSNNVTFPSGTLVNGNEQHYISIITAGCDSINSFNLDGLPLSTQNISSLQSANGAYCVLRTLINGGFHSVTHPSASFLVLVYGFGKFESYAFVAKYRVHTDSMDVAVSTPTNAISLGCLSFEKSSMGTLVPSKDLYNFGDSVTVYCRQGFDLLGDETLVCLSSGYWHGEIPRCSLNMLKTTQDSTNGSTNTLIIVSASSVGGVVLLIILVVILMCYCKRSHASTSDAAPPVYYASNIQAISGLRNQGIPDANNEEGNDNAAYLSIDPATTAKGSPDDYQGLYAVVE